MTCPNCKNDTLFRYVIARKWFRLFFVPVVPYETRHFLICPVCTSGKQLNSTEARRANQMVGLTRLWTSDQMDDESYFEAVTAFWTDEQLPTAPSPAASTLAAQPSFASTSISTKEPPRLVGGHVVRATDKSHKWWTCRESGCGWAGTSREEARSHRIATGGAPAAAPEVPSRAESNSAQSGTVSRLSPVPPPPVPLAPERDTKSDFKSCPDCAEEVKFAARKCRFCGYLFSSPGSEADEAPKT
jgi:uncharacterized protein UPF0547/zinc ribbon protein